MVSKWVGKHEENSGGVEAELDIQYIMGQAVGIKTEFWEFPGMDFGADLNQWTSNLTTVAGVPIVHSVSCAHLTAPCAPHRPLPSPPPPRAALPPPLPRAPLLPTPHVMPLLLCRRLAGQPEPDPRAAEGRGRDRR